MPSYSSSRPGMQQPHAHLDFGCLQQDSGLRQGNSVLRPDLDTFILLPAISWASQGSQ